MALRFLLGYFFFFIDVTIRLTQEESARRLLLLCFLTFHRKIDGAYCYSCHRAFSLRCSGEEEEEEAEGGAGQFRRGGGCSSSPPLPPHPPSGPSSYSRGALASVFHRSSGRPCEDPTRRRGKQPGPSSAPHPADLPLILFLASSPFVPFPLKSLPSRKSARSSPPLSAATLRAWQVLVGRPAARSAALSSSQ